MADAATIERAGETLRLRGPVTLDNLQELLGQATAAVTGGAAEVDLSGVTEVDSSIVALMLACVRDARAKSAAIRFRNLPASVQTLIGLYDVGDLLPTA
jgi:phospholipid transport system transporter-binding protein